MPTTPESYMRPLPRPGQGQAQQQGQALSQRPSQGQGPGSFPLPRPQAPQPLNLPPPPPGLNQFPGQSGGVPPAAPPGPAMPQMPPPGTPFDQMAAFQGFPGTFPGQNAPNPGQSPQERTMQRLENLNLPPQVVERLRQTLTGQGGGGQGSGQDAGQSALSASDLPPTIAPPQKRWTSTTWGR